MQEYIEEIYIWVLTGIVGLITWIFKSSQSNQDFRMDKIENRQLRLEDRLQMVVDDIGRQIQEADDRDSERHDRDRLETKSDIKDLRDRNDLQHDALLIRLDTIINGKK